MDGNERPVDRFEEHRPRLRAIAHRMLGSLAEAEALLADSVGLALLVVLDTLSPAERLAFVLHDVFRLPFEDIAAVVGRTAAARQLAGRARPPGADRAPRSRGRAPLRLRPPAAAPPRRGPG